MPKKPPKINGALAPALHRLLAFRIARTNETQGLKPGLLSPATGTTEAMPCYKASDFKTYFPEFQHFSKMLKFLARAGRQKPSARAGGRA